MFGERGGAGGHLVSDSGTLGVRRRRAIALLVPVVPLVAAMACGDSTDTPPVVGDAAVDSYAVDAADGGDSSSSNQISGVVLDFLDESPVAGAKIAVVDANGAIRSAVTDKAGSFTVNGVDTPYTLRVSPNDPAFGWWIFDHLSTRALVLGAGGKLDPSIAWANHKVTGNCSFVAPACVGGSNCPLNVSVWSPKSSTDLQASGGFLTNFAGGTFSFNVDIQWVGVSASRVVTFDALAHDVGNFNFSYAKQTLSVQDGQPFACPTMTLAPVGAVGSFSTTVTMNNVPSALTQSTDAFFIFGSGGTADAVRTNGPSIAFGVPDIGLKGLSVTGVARDVNNSMFARTDTAELPPTASTASLVVYGPPTILSPPGGGTVQRTDKLKWVDGSGSATYFWELHVQTDGGQPDINRGYIVTDQLEFPLSTLEKLTVPVPAGSYTGSLSARRPLTTTDALVSGPKVPKFYGTAYSESVVKFTIAP